MMSCLAIMEPQDFQMRASDTSPANYGHDLSVEEQFFTLLPLARLMIERGVTPYPEFRLVEFDATALLFAHSAGRLTLRPAILRAVIRVSRGEGYRPNRTVRREIAARARELLSRSTAVLRAMESQAPGEGEEQ
jgi:hypothetical protein